MSLTKSTEAYFFPDFTPLLYDKLNSNSLKVAKDWLVADRGRPLHSLNPYKLAAWHGHSTRLDETPVIGAAVGIEKRVVDTDTAWFCGLTISYPALEAMDSAEQEQQLYDSLEYELPTASDCIKLLSRFLKTPSTDLS